MAKFKDLVAELQSRKQWLELTKSHDWVADIDNETAAYEQIERVFIALLLRLDLTSLPTEMAEAEMGDLPFNMILIHAGNAEVGDEG